MPTRTQAFTLIELLVVVTIIVILVAMMAPALERAVYTAQLTVCSAQIDTMVMGITQYSMDHKRWFPYKRPVHTHESWWSLSALRSLPIAERSPQRTGEMQRYDYRIMVADYYSHDLFVDPLAEPLDMDPEVNDNDATIIASYTLMDGIKYTGGVRSEDGTINLGSANVGRGMMKLGDQLTWVGPDNIEMKFNVLVGDLMDTTLTDTKWSSGHVDREGNASRNYWDGVKRAHNVGGANQYQKSWWNHSIAEKGIADLNFGFQDGSVVRYAGLEPMPNTTPFNRGDYPLSPTPTLTESNPPNGPNPPGWANGAQTWLPAGP